MHHPHDFLLPWMMVENKFIINNAFLFKLFFFSNWRALDPKTFGHFKGQKRWPFVYGAPDRQVTVDPFEGTDSFTSMPYPGFEPGTLGVAVGSPTHYTSWSAYTLKCSLRFRLSANNNICGSNCEGLLRDLLKPRRNLISVSYKLDPEDNDFVYHGPCKCILLTVIILWNVLKIQMITKNLLNECLSHYKSLWILSSLMFMLCQNH